MYSRLYYSFNSWIIW